MRIAPGPATAQQARRQAAGALEGAKAEGNGGSRRSGTGSRYPSRSHAAGTGPERTGARLCGKGGGPSDVWPHGLRHSVRRPTAHSVTLLTQQCLCEAGHQPPQSIKELVPALPSLHWCSVEWRQGQPRFMLVAACRLSFARGATTESVPDAGNRNAKLRHNKTKRHAGNVAV
jgi:hypothetical protein